MGISQVPEAVLLRSALGGSGLERRALAKSGISAPDCDADLSR